MTETIKTLLQPIQNRLNAAIPGPWEPMRAGLLGTRVVSIDGEWEGIIPPEFIKMVTPAMRNFDTAVFIAAAPTDQARLLAAVQAVVAEIADTDLETNEAQQGDLADRILVAVEAALGGEA